MHRFANPRRFLDIADRVFPWLAGATVFLFALGLYLSLLASPADYQQGEAVRIMYIHVPAAWMAMFMYMAMSIAAIVGMVWKHPLADLFAKAAAPLGAGFTALCLVTGSLWGKPMWGTWWVWDARLTSVLILFFLYLGYIALVHAFDDESRGLKAGALLLVVGLVNIPIIKFSVDWWNTLHQPASVSRLGTPAVDPSMLAPLLIMTLAFTCYGAVVLLIRLKSEILARKIRTEQMATAMGRAPAAAE